MGQKPLEFTPRRSFCEGKANEKLGNLNGRFLLHELPVPLHAVLVFPRLFPARKRPTFSLRRWNRS